MLKQNTGLYIIIFGFFVLLVVVFYFFVPSSDEGEVALVDQTDKEQVQDTSNNQLEGNSLNQNNQIIESELDKKEPVRINIGQTEKKEVAVRQDMNIFEIERMAASYAERYGTYSNQSNFSNLENLALFMTEANEKKTKRYIEEQRMKVNDVNSNIYYGITTRVISKKIQDYQEGSRDAKVLVDTIRLESTGTQGNSVRIEQQAFIYLKKERGAWKVDEVEWL